MRAESDPSDGIDPASDAWRGDGSLDACAASIRFVGRDLDPAELTRRLGAAPRTARFADDPENKARDAAGLPVGIWAATRPTRRGLAPETLLDELLDSLTQDLDVWRELGARFRGDAFCGLFLSNSGRGPELSPRMLQRLAERGLSLDLDIYAS